MPLAKLGFAKGKDAGALAPTTGDNLRRRTQKQAELASGVEARPLYACMRRASPAMRTYKQLRAKLAAAYMYHAMKIIAWRSKIAYIRHLRSFSFAEAGFEQNLPEASGACFWRRMAPPRRRSFFFMNGNRRFPVINGRRPCILSSLLAPCKSKAFAGHNARRALCFETRSFAQQSDALLRKASTPPADFPARKHQN